MKRRITAIVLVVSLLLTLVPAVFAADYNKDKIVNAAIVFFAGHEGDYDNVVLNDSGALGIGKLGWHGIRACHLLKMIVSKNPSQAKAILGDALYNEIVNKTEQDWRYRQLSADEGAKIKALITTPEGIAAQDELAVEDVSTYIGHAYNFGIRTDAAIMYYCDIENQYGYGGATNVVNYAKGTLGGATMILSLDQFHNALLNTSASYIQNYIKRRKTTYNYIKNTLGWDTTTGVPTTTTYKGLNDIPLETNWAYEGIVFSLDNGLLKGVSKTKFEPETSMTRAMLVTVLHRLAGEPKANSANTFTDVPAGTYYTDAVIWAEANGIVDGVGEGRFDPNSVVTREQIATILYNYAKFKGQDTDSRADLSSFPDCSSVSNWAYEALSWSNAEGLINGVAKNNINYLRPDESATRAQVATILMRYVKGN